MGSAPSASARPPSERERASAVAAVTAACRTGRLDLDGAEERLAAIFAARTFADLHQAVAGLPSPPAPFVLPSDA